MMIKVRNLEGVASTVQAVVREYHILEEHEIRAVNHLERTHYELFHAERVIEASRARASEISRDPLAGLGLGKIVSCGEEDERRRSESALLVDLIRRVEVLREDLIRARTEAEDDLASIQFGKARERKLQHALEKGQRVGNHAEGTGSRVG